MENNGELSHQEDAEFRNNAYHIVQLIEENENMFTEEEQKQLEIANDALEYWIEQGNVKRAYWETENTLNLVEKIIKSKEF
tara:strand:- start:762 stop:1004 length:243 start_codon:yes stop_codon:yes gene_type:complete